MVRGPCIREDYRLSVVWREMKLNRSIYIAARDIAAIARVCILVLFLQLLSALTAKGTEATFLLSGTNWWLHEDSGRIDPTNEFIGAEVPASGWIAATVPGNIQADVENAHLLSPLWYGETDTNLYQVAEHNWWYRNDFVIPKSYAGKRLTLIFDGVDQKCKVWLNGHEIGSNPDMFRRFWFDVTDVAKTGFTNHLAIWIARMPRQLVPYLVKSDGIGDKDPFGPYGFMTGVNETRKVLKDLKTPGNFSYDWSFNVWTLGIWKNVRLEATGPARIVWTRVQSTLSHSNVNATIQATLDVDSLVDLPAKAEFRIRGHGTFVSKVIETDLHKGRNVVKVRIPIENPALWWPNGFGPQALYNLQAKLQVDGTLSDMRSVCFGVRDIRWVPTLGASTNYPCRYQMIMNGTPIRTIGSALILPGVLPGCVSQRNLRLLYLAKKCGMNTLRLNGGGGGGPMFNQAWYDLADKLGIMIQYEFPIGNCTPETDSVFLKNVDITCRNMVKQSRNHPSIIQYVGGSEMDWDSDSKEPALLVMRKVVAQESDRLFRATSPDLGDKHAPWDFDILGTDSGGYEGSYAHYNGKIYSTKNPHTQAMSYSEFGSCSPAYEEVWYRDVPLASQWPLTNLDDPVLIRMNAWHAVFAPQYWLKKDRIDAVFNVPDNLHDLIAAGQYLGADGLRYIFDALRRKGRQLGNITSHCFGEPWPNLAGSFLVDFAGRPLMNYDFVKQALSPVSLSLQFNSAFYSAPVGVKAELFLVSDAPNPAQGLHWQWVARDRKGNIFAHNGGTAEIQPLEVKDLGSLMLKLPTKDAAGLMFVELRLTGADGTLLTERLEIFGDIDRDGPLAGLLRNRNTFDETASESLQSRKNLALVRNGAKPAIASSSRPGHSARFLNDGKYGNQSTWIGNSENPWLEIDLGKVATIGRFVLGRDRAGLLNDRPLGYLKIDTSLDAKQWRTVFERGGLTALNGAGPGKSLHIDVTPIKARFVKATVGPAVPKENETPCLDEFEVYGPAKTQAAELPHVMWGRPADPVCRTTLKITKYKERNINGQDIITLHVRNTGPMTALFVEPHPLLAYRTDLFIDNNNCFIPPKESRVITISACDHSRDGLSLAQTGWVLSCWNADNLQIPPSDKVILSVGRWDEMCREFYGYFNAKQAQADQVILCRGNRPDASTLPYLLNSGSVVQFDFRCSRYQATHIARLRIHTSDQSAVTKTVVQISINGRTIQGILPKGLGIQRKDPEHLAFPATAEFHLLPSDLKRGGNRLTVRVMGNGWFTWDSLDLVNVE